jgi:Fe2+ transport system protein FeoA
VQATLLPKGKKVIVDSINIGPYASRLLSAGIRKGANLEFIKKTTGGGLLFKVEQHRVVIHKSLASTIQVSEQVQ